MASAGRPWISIQQYQYEYTTWEDFLVYRPFETQQWKTKVLVWWSVEDSFLQLVYLSPEKGLSADSWATVRIGVKGVGVEKIRAWIQSQNI